MRKIILSPCFQEHFQPSYFVQTKVCELHTTKHKYYLQFKNLIENRNISISVGTGFFIFFLYLHSFSHFNRYVLVA